jgi:hypothetical protein
MITSDYTLKWLHSDDYVPTHWSGYTVLITSLHTEVVTQWWLRPYTLKWLHSADYVPTHW